jgi:PKD repeat protein
VPASQTIFRCLDNGNTVDYQATLGAAADSVVWILTGGSPSKHVGASINGVTYASVGIYSSSVSVYRNSDTIADTSYSFLVNIEQIGGISFVPSQTIFCESDPLFTLDGFSPPGGFFEGPGISGSQFDPATAGVGTHTIQYILNTTSCGDDTVSATITVIDAPDATLFSTGNLTNFQGQDVYTFCPPSAATFTFLTTTPSTEYTSFTFSYGDGTADSTGTVFPATITHTYPDGFYTATLYLTHNNGCVSEASVNIFYGSNPAVGLNLSGNNEACLTSDTGSVVYYFPTTGTASNPPGTIYEVEYNDGSPNEIYTHPPPDSIAHRFRDGSCGTNATTFNNAFQVKIIARNPCSSSAATVEPIFISTPAEPDFDLSSAACVNVPITVGDSSRAGSYVSGSNNNNCGTNAKLIWAVSPNTYTLNAGSFGIVIGGSQDPANWIGGSSSLDITFNRTGIYTIQQKIGSVLACNNDSLTQTVCVDTLPIADMAINPDSICVGDSITARFIGNVFGLCETYTIDWDVTPNTGVMLGDSADFDTTQNFIFTQAGRYAIRMVASNSCGIVELYDTVTVRGIPTSFFPKDTLICDLNTVSYSWPDISPIVSDSFSVVTYAWGVLPAAGWNLANGTNLSDTLPDIEFTQFGTFQVYLTTSNDCGDYTDTMEVQITAPPVLSAGQNPFSDTLLCYGESIGYQAFISSGFAPFQLSWGGGNGVVQSTIDTIYLNNLTADTSIFVRVIDQLGCSDSAFFTVNVLPEIVVDAGADVNICYTDSTQLMGSFSGGVGPFNFSWQPAVGLSDTTVLQPWRSPLDSTVTYTLTVTDTLGCAFTDQVTVNVYPLPVFTAGNDFTLCVNQGDTVLNGFTPAGGTWSGVGITDSTFSPSTAGLGTYVLTYQYIDVNACVFVDSIVATVISQPDANFGSDIEEGCTPLTVSFFDSSGVAGGQQWYANGTFFSNAQNPMQTFVNNSPDRDTLIDILLLFQAGSGCSDSLIRTITIHPQPQADFLISDTICAGDSAQVLNTTLVKPGAASYQWYVSGVNVSISNATDSQPTFTFPDFNQGVDSVYTISLVVTSLDGCTDSIAKDVTIKSRPQAKFSLPIGACSPVLINPLDSSIGSSLTYNWSISPTTNVTLTNAQTASPDFSFGNVTDSAAYTIRLIVTDGFGCVDSTQATYTVSAKPIAGFTVALNDSCGPFTARFTNTSLTNISGEGLAEMTFTWDFGNGQTSTATDPVQLFTNTGTIDSTYTIQLIAANSLGCSDTLYDTVRVYPDPIARILLSDSVDCAPFVLDSTVVSAQRFDTANATYTWRLLDMTGNVLDTFTGANGVKDTITQDGDTIQLQLIVTSPNGCRNDTATQLFYTIENPNAFFVAIPDSTCSGGTISFQDSSGGGVTHEWFANGVLFSTISSPSESFFNNSNTLDSIIVIKHRITAGGSGCADSLSVNIVVHPAPSTQFTIPAQLCANDSTQAVNTSIGVGLSYVWSASSPAVGISDALANAPFFYFPDNQSGFDSTYTIQLVSTSIYGCTDTNSQTIVINSRPVADFQLPASGCGPLSINPTDASSGNTLSYQWSVQPAAIITNSATNSPTFDFSLPPSDSTVYTISLMITDANGCVDSVSEDYTVYAKPAAGFAVALSDSCGPFNARFTNTSLTNISGEGLAEMTFTWDFGNGQTSTATNPVQLFTNTGAVDSLYTIQLIATNSLGCSDTIYDTVRVYPDPIARILLSDSVDCAPFELDSTVVRAQLFDTANATFTWRLLDVYGNLLNTYIGVNAVNYTISQDADTVQLQLIVSSPNGCRNDTANQIFYTIENPNAFFVATPDSICSGGIINFQDSSGAGVTHEWFANGVLFSTLSSPSENFFNNSNTSDSVIVIKHRVTAGSNGCIDSLSLSIIIHPQPLAQFNLPAQLCANDSVQPTNNTAGISNAYHWSASSSAVVINDTSVASPFIRFPDNQSGFDSTYTVQLIVTSFYGCVDTITQTVVVNSRPVADFQLPAPGCAPLSVNPTDASSGAGLSYSWQVQPTPLNQTGINTATPQFDFGVPVSDSLVYNIRLQVTDVNGCVDSISRTFSVYPLPLAGFTPSNQDSCGPLSVTFFNTSLSNIPGDGLDSMTFSWDFGNGQTSTDSVPTVVYTNAGSNDTTYFIQLVVSNRFGCIDTTSDSVIVRPDPRALINTSITSACAPFVINDTIANAVEFPATNAAYSWEILDAQGQTLLQSFSGPTGLNYTLLAASDSVLIRLMVSSPFGCRVDTTEQLFYTIPNPQPGFALDTNEGCHPLTVVATDTSLMGFNRAWYVNGVLQSNTSANPAFTFGNSSLIQDSVYEIKLVITASTGCSDSISQLVTVHPLPNTSFTATEECQGDSTYFTNNTNSFNAIAQWDWDFGDGNSSNAFEPVHVYSSPGVYAVQLTATTSEGCLESFTDTLIVRPNPIASFSAAQSCGLDTACLNDAFSFTDLSTLDSLGGSIVNWHWDINNDGTIEYTVQNPQHTFNQVGTFDVKLIIESTYGCLDSIVRQVLVLDSLSGGFSVDTVPICGPANINVTNAATGPISEYLWQLVSFDASGNEVVIYTSTQADPNPIPTLQPNYVRDSVYILRQTITNCCDSISVEQRFIIKPLPVGGIVALSPSGCSGFIADFTIDGQSTGDLDSVIVDFGDGSPLQTYTPTPVFFLGDTLYLFGNQQHMFTNNTATDTTYIVTITAYNACGDSTASTPVVVNPRLVQTSFTYAPLQGCEDLTVTFTDASFGGVSYIWYFDYDSTNASSNQFADSGLVVSHTYTDPGTYLVAHIVGDGCSYDTAYTTISVFDSPEVAFTHTNFVCPGDSVHFTNQTIVSTGTISLTRWNFGDGQSSIQKDPSHVYDTSGVYTVWLISGSTNGCEDSVSHVITVHPVPDVDFSFTNACVGTPINFYDSTQTNGVNITTTTWQIDTLATYFSNPGSFMFNTPGLYEVKLSMETDQGCIDSVVKTVEVFDSPTAAFTVQQDFSVDSCGNIAAYLFRDQSTSTTPLQYEWDFDLDNPGVMTSTLRNPGTQIYPDTGFYYISMAVWNPDSCYDQVIDTLYVDPKSRVDFSPAVVEACMNELIQFYDSTRYRAGGNVNDLSFLWSFGDGNTSTQRNPSHAYTSAGTYTIKLVVTDPNCADSITRNVTIHQTPNAQIRDLNYQVCEGETVTIVSDMVLQFANGDQVDTLIWYSNDGQELRVYRDSLVQMDFDTVGRYEVGLVAISDKGCRDSSDARITVDIFPIPVVTLDTLQLNARTFLFSAEVQKDENAIYRWDFGDGNTLNAETPDSIEYRYQDNLCRIDEAVKHTVSLTVLNQFEGFGTCGSGDTLDIKMTGYHLNVPNAFAPDRNNILDANVFMPKGRALGTYRLKVYDEWGNVVFQTTKLENGKPGEPWDGTLDGVDLPMGAYYWVIDAEFNDGEIWPIEKCNDVKAYGTVTLIR